MLVPQSTWWALQDLAQISLECKGYRVLLARDGQESVRLFEANWEKIDLVVLDVVMPQLTGPEAYSRMCALSPIFPSFSRLGTLRNQLR
jgi:two-component system, cell cycle sensor histidine kinase and response regulator CckA